MSHSHAANPVQQIVLRQPRLPRSPSQSPRGPQFSSPLLPVFLAGEENRFVAFVCGASDDSPSPTGAARTSEELMSLASMGPLLLVGPSGAGKSALAVHLAALLLDQPSAALEAEETAQRTALAMMPAIDFARLYARAVDADDISRFRAELQSVPVMVIDDVHQIIDKPAAQDELASRIEARVAAALPTILTCRRLPTQVSGLRPLLVSRMLPGLTVPVRLPGRATSEQLIRLLSDRRGVFLGDDDVRLLVDGLPAEVTARQLDSAARHLELWCRMKASPPNIIALREAIAAVEPQTEVSTDQVAKTVARKYKLKLSELKSGTRRQEVVRARSLAMYLARQLTGTSYDKIGKYFGGRDHTTVLHACRKTETLFETDDELRMTANEVSDQLRQSA